jgi:NADH-quinone oxidoreductase subunit C
VPDATGLELLAQELRESEADAVRDTEFFRGKAALHIDPTAIRATLEFLRAKGFTFLASVHGLDYYPDEPRLGVQYELLSMEALDRITVKLRVPIDEASVPSVTPQWTTADHH